MIDRKTLIATVTKTLFGGAMPAQARKGLEWVLKVWEGDPKNNDLRWLAYELATYHHETGRRLWPIIETTSSRDKAPVSVDTAIRRLDTAWKAGRMTWVKTRYWAKDALGRCWLGRGLPQVTHEPNYKKAQTKTGFPVHDDPENMLKIEYAAPIAHRGMTEGWFTGRTLRNYFNGTTCDWFNARRIINRTESAAKVAAYAKLYYSALTQADAADPEPVTHEPAPAELNTAPIDATVATAGVGTAAVTHGLVIFGVAVPLWLVAGASVAALLAAGYLLWRYRLTLKEMVEDIVNPVPVPAEE